MKADSIVNRSNIVRLLRSQSPTMRAHALHWLRARAEDRLRPLAVATVPGLDWSDVAVVLRFAQAVEAEHETRPESKPPTCGVPTNAERAAARLLKWCINCERLGDPGEGWRSMLVGAFDDMESARNADTLKEAARRAREEAKRNREAAKRRC